MDEWTDRKRVDPNGDIAALNAASIGGPGGEPPLLARLAAVVSVARYHGVELDPQSVKLNADEEVPSPPALVVWLQESWLWARGVRLSFRQLM